MWWEQAEGVAEWTTVTIESGGDETTAQPDDEPAGHPRFAGWYEELPSAEEVNPDSLRTLDQALADIDRTTSRRMSLENSHLVQAFNTRHARPRGLTGANA